MTDQPHDTRAVDEASEADAQATGGNIPGRDGGPQDADDMRAAEGLSASEDVKESYGDMLERGADQKGEGRVP